MAIDPHHISLSEFDIQPESLGSGAYSEIVLVIHKRDQKKYAMKVVNKSKAERNNNVKYFVNERRIMFLFDHHRIVKLRWTTKDDQNIYFIYDMAPHGEMWEILRGFPGFIPHPHLRRIWASQLFSAVEYCHLNFKLAHRDIKPENILIDENFNLLLCDFGTSKIMTKEVLDAEYHTYLRAVAEATVRVNQMEEERKTMNFPDLMSAGVSGPDVLSAEENRRRSILYQASRVNSFTGTPHYMAPEVIQTYGTRGTASDLWSLGVFLFQMETGELPFQHESPYAVLNEVVEFNCDLNKVADDIAKDLIRQLLQKDPKKRLGVVEDDRRLFYGLVAPLNEPLPPSNNDTNDEKLQNGDEPIYELDLTKPQGAKDAGDDDNNYLDEVDSLTKRRKPKLLSDTTVYATELGWNSIKAHPYFTRLFNPPSSPFFSEQVSPRSTTPQSALSWDCDLSENLQELAKRARDVCFNFITFSDENGNPIAHPKHHLSRSMQEKEAREILELEKQLEDSFPTIVGNLNLDNDLGVDSSSLHQNNNNLTTQTPLDNHNFDEDPHYSDDEDVHNIINNR